MLSSMITKAAAVLLLASVLAAPGAAESPCACAAKKRCWNLVISAYRRKTILSEEEVEKSLPNRFFPGTHTFALRRPTEDGHFLAVECGAARIPCTDKREELERRLIVSGLLASLPLSLPEGTLYDPATWKISVRGEKTFSEVKSCRKGLIRELAAVVLGAGAE
jgi:hypothetical protein